MAFQGRGWIRYRGWEFDVDMTMLFRYSGIEITDSPLILIFLFAVVSHECLIG